MNTTDFTTFNLSKSILKSIKKLGYKSPTQIQQKVIPLILSGRDIIGKSQTGSGKTAAYGIPVCEKINIECKSPQVLILAPTRELCVQISEDISNIGRFKKIKCTAVFGKSSMGFQKRELKQRTHIVVGTPGRTIDHIKKGNLNLYDIKYLIIDEADEMLNMGFIGQVEDIIKSVPKDRVTLLFSATIPKEIESICHNYMINPVSINILPQTDITETIAQSCFEVPEYKKKDILKYIIYTQNPQSSIIFCNTKEKTDKVFEELQKEGFSCSKLHGGMLQDDRLKVMENFKKGDFIFLAATDLAARGIDVDDINLIINYDVPFEKENYIHRIGRTGRAGKKGTAVIFASPFEINYLNEIEKYLSFTIPREKIPDKDQIKAAKESYIRNIPAKPVPKTDKSAQISMDITKIYINAGKKKKIRSCDIVGALTAIEGITADDIGIIDISPGFSYVDILNDKGNTVLDALKNIKIKGKQIKAEKAEK